MKKNAFLLAGCLLVVLFWNTGFAGHNEAVIDDFKSLNSNALPQLIEMAGSEDPGDEVNRINAIKRIAELAAEGANVKNAVPTILACLEYGSSTRVATGDTKLYPWEVRFQSAGALGIIKDERAVNPLVKQAFIDEEVMVRRMSIQALGKLGEASRTTTVLDRLYDMLERVKDQALAADICETLGMIGDKSAFVYLLRVTQGDYLKYVKEKAQAAIKKLDWNKKSVYEQ